MERVLSSVELLDMIFSFTERGTDALCARVNKTFFETATKRLWYKVENLQKIFEVLAPIKKNEKTDQLRFIRELRIDDWDRFYSYATKVKHLIIDEETWIMGRVHQEVSRNRTQFHIFPNLVKLDITINCSISENAALYMNKGLREIVIRINRPEDIPGLVRVLRVISERAQTIKDFSLLGDIEIRSVEPQLAQLFQKQEHLQFVALPLYSVTSSIASSLASVRSLVTIALEYFTDWGKGNPEDVLEFNPNLPVGAFPTLKSLSFAASIQDTKQFFSMKYAPRQIETLYLHAMDIGTSNLITEYIEILADTCTCLTSVGLNMLREVTSEMLDNAYTITFDALRPLLKLEDMNYFEIHHPRPLAIATEDMKALAQSWPSLKTLRLNPEPLIPDDPQSDISVLDILAENCSELVNLEIYINTNTVDDLPIASNPFESLQNLSFGSSFITDPQSVSVYISQICPASCKLTTHISWDEDTEAIIDESYLDSRSSDQELWEKVKELLPIVGKAVERDRRYIKELEKKVENLQSKIDNTTKKASE